MCDAVFIGALALIPILLSVISVREYLSTRRAWHLLPIAAYLIALLGLVFKDWLPGLVWTLIGLVLRVVLKKAVRE